MSIPRDRAFDTMNKDRQTHSNTETASASAPEPRLPSEVAPPTRTDSASQQASTNPGDGTREQDPNSTSKVPWKDEVIGYAKVARGKILGKKGTEELGHKILEGQVEPKETHKS